MKNIVLFLSAACLLSAPIFGQQQENRFAEITNPQLLSINKLPPHASFTSYIDETSALNKDKANGSFYLPLNMEIPLYRKIQRKTHEFHGARF